MDCVLHEERLNGRAKRLHRSNIEALPDGTFIALDGDAFAVHDAEMLHWAPTGYDWRRSRPQGTTVDVLTPPAIVAVLSAGYKPRWHPSADDWGQNS
jgi:hypothetical protein